jgi:hypothetical protein
MALARTFPLPQLVEVSQGRRTGVLLHPTLLRCATDSIASCFPMTFCEKLSCFCVRSGEAHVFDKMTGKGNTVLCAGVRPNARTQRVSQWFFSLLKVHLNLNLCSDD